MPDEGWSERERKRAPRQSAISPRCIPGAPRARRARAHLPARWGQNHRAHRPDTCNIDTGGVPLSLGSIYIYKCGPTARKEESARGARIRGCARDPDAPRRLDIDLDALCILHSRADSYLRRTCARGYYLRADFPSAGCAARPRDSESDSGYICLSGRKIAWERGVCDNRRNIVGVIVKFSTHVRDSGKVCVKDGQLKWFGSMYQRVGWLLVTAVTFAIPVCTNRLYESNNWFGSMICFPKSYDRMWSSWPWRTLFTCCTGVDACAYAIKFRDHLREVLMNYFSDA